MAALRVRQVTQTQTQPLGYPRRYRFPLVAAGALGGLTLFWLYLTHNDGQVFGLPTAEHGDRAAGTRFGIAYQTWQINRLVDDFAIEAGDDVPRLNARLASRRVGLDPTHQSPFGLSQAQRLGHVFGHLIDGHADATARDLACSAQLL